MDGNSGYGWWSLFQQCLIHIPNVWDRTVAQNVFKIAWCPFLLRRRGKDLEMYCRCEDKGPILCGGLLLAWPESHCYLPKSRTHRIPHLGWDEIVSTGEYCWLTCCLFTSQSPPTKVRWPDPIGPKWLPLESQLPAVFVPWQSPLSSIGTL